MRFIRLFCVFIIMATGIFLALSAFSQTEEKTGAEKPPEKGISITLSIYSGRPNPQWWLTSDADLKKIIGLIESLKVSGDSLFNYGEWNRLGYASFYIEPKGLDKATRSIHVWRDMAYFLPDKDGRTGYALKATDLYDLLVEQAESRKLGSYFENYRKTQKK